MSGDLRIGCKRGCGRVMRDLRERSGEGMLYICMYCGEVESYSGATLPFLPRSSVSTEANIEKYKLPPRCGAV